MTVEAKETNFRSTLVECGFLKEIWSWLRLLASQLGFFDFVRWFD